MSAGAATCYREVVVDDFYGLFPIAKTFQPNVIVDIGANIGMFSVLASLLFPQATIFSYEPNAETFTWLKRNAIGGKFVLNNSGVSSKSGFEFFDPGSDSTLGMLNQVGTLQVEVIGPHEVADGQAIDLLKMDCEGAEWEILRDGELIRRSARICMEYHVRQGCGVRELEQLLRDGGHQILKLEPHFHQQSGRLISTKT